MKKGFLAIVLVLAIFSSFFQVLSIHNDFYGGIQKMKNELVLQQTINEKTYEIENGFKDVVREGLKETSEEILNKKIPTQERIFIICKKIENWANEFENIKFKVGYVKRNDYSYEQGLNFIFDLFSDIKNILTKDWKSIIEEKMSPCINFIFVNEETAVIMDNRFLDFGVDPNIFLTNHAVAFVFEVETYKAKFKVLIPEGTVIENEGTNIS